MPVGGRNHHQVECRGGEKPPQNHHRHGSLDLAARHAGPERQRYQSQGGGEGGHEDGADPFHGTAGHRLTELGHTLLFHQMTDVGDKQDAVSGGDTKKGNKADDGGHRQDPARQVHPGDAADERQREIEHNDERIAPGTKYHHKNRQDTRHNESPDAEENASGFRFTLELPSILDPVPMRKWNCLVNATSDLLDGGDQVPARHVTRDDDPPLGVLAGQNAGSVVFGEKVGHRRRFAGDHRANSPFGILHIIRFRKRVQFSCDLYVETPSGLTGWLSPD